MRPLVLMAGLTAGALLSLTSCLDHRTAQNCEFRAPPGSKEPGEDCTEDEECVPGSVCFEGTCVGDGSLRISLGWDRVTDFDLHVITPDGSEIYYANPTADGGTLDVDDCVVTCADPNDTHVENIFFDETALIGTYQVFVVNFNGRRADDYFIEVEGDGVYEFWQGSLAGSSNAMSPIYTFVYDPPPEPSDTTEGG